MSPERLNEDQRLLYEILRDIWSRYARRLLAGVLVVGLLCVGITVGVLLGTRQTLRQTVRVMKGVQDQVDLNHRIITIQIEQSRIQQQRYASLINAVEALHHRVDGQDGKKKH